MTSALDAYLVAEAATVRDAMAAVDRGAARIALAVDADGRLTGVVTDGDLRRALLGGVDLKDPVAPILTRRYLSVTPRDGRAAALELMPAASTPSPWSMPTAVRPACICCSSSWSPSLATTGR